MFIVVVLPLIGMTGSCYSSSQDKWRQGTIERGMAEYVMDPLTGKTEWRWKAVPAEVKP